MIYFDNAATSRQKPMSVIKSVNNALEKGFFAAHSSHSMSIENANIVYETREMLAKMFGVRDPAKVIFTMNATHALNIALHGILSEGDNVAVVATAHNSVMRPLHELEKYGVNVIIISCDKNAMPNMNEYTQALSTKKIKLTVLTHAGNVNGVIHDIHALAEIAKKNNSLVLLDAAQTAGLLEIDMAALKIDLLALTGHKTLFALQGIGALLLSDNFDFSRMKTIIQGGTGSKSEYESQPEMLPDKYESGTPNGIGIVSLHASLKWIEDNGKITFLKHERKLRERMFELLAPIPSIKIHGTKEHDNYTGIISLEADRATVSEVGTFLDEKYGILTRFGLHCSPLAHKQIGTFPGGTLRFSFSAFNTEDEVDKASEALKEYTKILCKK